MDEQNQNPVEREVQTLKKGVSALLIDQYSLGLRWWCYAVESWIATANSTAYGGLSASPFELVTGKVEDIGSKFRFPFGCPVSIKKTEGRESHYATANDFGIALGAVKGSNGSTIVLIPGRGTTPFERLHDMSENFCWIHPKARQRLLSKNSPSLHPQTATMAHSSSSAPPPQSILSTRTSWESSLERWACACLESLNARPGPRPFSNVRFSSPTPLPTPRSRTNPNGITLSLPSVWLEPTPIPLWRQFFETQLFSQFGNLPSTRSSTCFVISMCTTL